MIFSVFNEVLSSEKINLTGSHSMFDLFKIVIIFWLVQGTCLSNDSFRNSYIRCELNVLLCLGSWGKLNLYFLKVHIR